MTKRYLVNAIAGPLAERPDPSTPSGGASETPFGLYIDTGTGDIYESTGSAWVLVGTLAGNGATSITGLASDGSNGITVTGGVAAASVTATGDVGAGSVTSTGAVAGASVAATGAVTGASVGATGKVSGATLAQTTSGTGAPASGAHTQGEFHGDTAGALFYCTVAGTPGTWKQVTLT